MTIINKIPAIYLMIKLLSEQLNTFSSFTIYKFVPVRKAFVIEICTERLKIRQKNKVKSENSQIAARV